jgi:DNA-binding NarL/FixJ family response regulator
MIAEPTRLTVLLIEDDRSYALTLADVLRAEAQAHQQAMTLGLVDTLAGALARVREEPPAVILLDLGLPDAHGLEALRALREAVPQIPLIIVTGEADPDLALQAPLAGAYQYLPKARLSGERLWAVIQTAFRERREWARLQAELSALKHQTGRDLP